MNKPITDTSNMSNVTKGGVDGELRIAERIEMLKVIKPITDYLRRVTNDHDVNYMNSLLVTALLPYVDQSIKAQLQALLAELPEKRDFEWAGTNPNGGTYKTDYDAVKHGYNQAVDQVATVINKQMEALK